MCEKVSKVYSSVSTIDQLSFPQVIVQRDLDQIRRNWNKLTMYRPTNNIVRPAKTLTTDKLLLINDLQNTSIVMLIKLIWSLQN